jgi:hypothetical protein
VSSNLYECPLNDKFLNASFNSNISRITGKNESTPIPKDKDHRNKSDDENKGFNDSGYKNSHLLSAIDESKLISQFSESNGEKDYIQ